jgi:hypothetical protein
VSVRSLVEINHDYQINDVWIADMRQFLRSPGGDVHHGFRFVTSYHHSGDGLPPAKVHAALLDAVRALEDPTVRMDRRRLLILLNQAEPFLRLMANGVEAALPPPAKEPPLVSCPYSGGNGCRQTSCNENQSCVLKTFFPSGRQGPA